MKVFIGGELEHSISDKFRKARNSVIAEFKLQMQRNSY